MNFVDRLLDRILNPFDALLSGLETPPMTPPPVFPVAYGPEPQGPPAYGPAPYPDVPPVLTDLHGIHNWGESELEISYNGDILTEEDAIALSTYPGEYLGISDFSAIEKDAIFMLSHWGGNSLSLYSERPNVIHSNDFTFRNYKGESLEILLSNTSISASGGRQLGDEFNGSKLIVDFNWSGGGNGVALRNIATNFRGNRLDVRGILTNNDLTYASMFGGSNLVLREEEGVVNNMTAEGFRNLSENFKGDGLFFIGIQRPSLDDNSIYELSNSSVSTLYIRTGALSTQGARYLADNFKGKTLDMLSTVIYEEGRTYLIQHFKGRNLRINNDDENLEVAMRYDETIKETLQDLDLPTDVFECVVNPFLTDVNPYTQPQQPSPPVFLHGPEPRPADYAEI